jgi:hypothetical protein
VRTPAQPCARAAQSRANCCATRPEREPRSSAQTSASALAAAGKLHSDYPGIGCGYDQMTLDALGINIDTFKAFIDTKPSYPQLEAWVKAQPGVNLTQGNIYKHNQSIMGYIHDDATRKTILDADGIADDGSVNSGAVDLNNLDDWHIFWAQEIK